MTETLTKHQKNALNEAKARAQIEALTDDEKIPVLHRIPVQYREGDSREGDAIGGAV